MAGIAPPLTGKPARVRFDESLCDAAAQGNASRGESISLGPGFSRLPRSIAENSRHPPGRLAQLVRAPARQAGGHWFEPSNAHIRSPCSISVCCKDFGLFCGYFLQRSRVWILFRWFGREYPQGHVQPVTLLMRPARSFADDSPGDYYRPPHLLPPSLPPLPLHPRTDHERPRGLSARPTSSSQGAAQTSSGTGTCLPAAWCRT